MTLPGVCRVLVDPRVWEVFGRKIEGIEQDKLDRVINLVDSLHKEGKSLNRAMADALMEFKLA